MAKQLQTELTENGETSVVNWGGGIGFYSVEGDFGAGTCKLLVSFDGGTTYFSPGIEGEFTADAAVQFLLPACKLKAKLSESADPSIRVHIDSLR